MKKLIILSLSLLSVSCAQASQKPDQNFSPESHVCEQCDYRTAYKGHLTDHMRTHTGEKPKPFSCKQCDFRAAQTSSITTHMRTHRLKKN